MPPWHVQPVMIHGGEKEAQHPQQRKESDTSLKRTFAQEFDGVEMTMGLVVGGFQGGRSKRVRPGESW